MGNLYDKSASKYCCINCSPSILAITATDSVKWVTIINNKIDSPIKKDNMKRIVLLIDKLSSSISDSPKWNAEYKMNKHIDNKGKNVRLFKVLRWREKVWVYKDEWRSQWYFLPLGRYY